MRIIRTFRKCGRKRRLGDDRMARTVVAWFPTMGFSIERPLVTGCAGRGGVRDGGRISVREPDPVRAPARIWRHYPKDFERRLRVWRRRRAWMRCSRAGGRRKCTRAITPRSSTWTRLTGNLCGASRPVHFRGVGDGGGQTVQRLPAAARVLRAEGLSAGARD